MDNKKIINFSELLAAFVQELKKHMDYDKDYATEKHIEDYAAERLYNDCCDVEGYAEGEYQISPFELTEYKDLTKTVVLFEFPYEEISKPIYDEDGEIEDWEHIGYRLV